MRKPVLYIRLLVLYLSLAPVSAMAIDIGPMTWTPRSDWINVQNPSAIPTLAGYTAATGNGTTDDTAAIQAILTWITNHSNWPYRTIYFPPGTYKISSTLKITNVIGVSFIGCGSNTIISWAGPTGGAMFAPDNTDNMRYIGLVWEGNNKAAVAYEEDSQGNYAGGLRHENESFRDINAPATYAYLINSGTMSTTPTPPTAAIVSGYTNNPPSYTGETQLWNCRFYNCTQGAAEAWNIGNFFCWFYDSCEFDNCGVGINMYTRGGNVITNCHFQNSTVADILGGGDDHIRHCTSVGSAYFFSDPGSLPNPSDLNVIEDCWVDSWTNTGYAIDFLREGPTTLFDCTFTNPPSSVNSPIKTDTVNQDQAVSSLLILSNNYAAGLAPGTQLVNNSADPIFIDNVPPGLRFGALTLQSASQTFLNTSYPADSTHILDISKAPYAQYWIYPGNQNGVPDITIALQIAVNDAKAANNGSIVYIPTDIYNISATITMSGSNYTVEGNGISSQLCWWGADNSTMISITSPTNLSVQKLKLTGTDGTIAGITATSATATNLFFDGIIYGSFAAGNPGANGADYFDGPGLVLNNLPAGSTVYMPLLQSSMTIHNCGGAQILTKYFAQDGTLTVSGTTPQTGFLGTVFTEGGQQIFGNYDVTVTDNQDLIFGDYYVEQEDNNLSLSRGAGTGSGRITIGGINTASGNNNGESNSSQYLVNVNNYAGRLFYGSGNLANWDAEYPVSITQTGSNAIDLIFAGTMPYDSTGHNGFLFTTGSSANVIATFNANQYPYPCVDLADIPNPPTAADFLSIAQSLDHFRQLEAVDLSVQDGVSTDGPAIAQYPFEGNALDMTGNYNGTASNVSYVPGLGSQAASFNGTNSSVQIGNPVTTNFSIAMWIYTTATGGTGQWYNGEGLVDGEVTPGAADFGTSLAGGRFAFGIGNPDTTLTSTVAVNNGAWHHLVATWNSTTGAMQTLRRRRFEYQQGWPHRRYERGGKSLHRSIQTGISGGFFNGVIDQVQIFNYVLNGTDVANLYNRSVSLLPPPSVSGLVAYWKLDESTGSTSYDSSGNNINGTQVNGPTFTTNHPSKINFTDPGSLLFNGVNQYVTMGAPAQLPNGKQPRTICAWAKSAGGSGYRMFASFGTPQNDEGMWLGANGTSLSAGSWGDDMPDIPGFWDGNWHFICMTFDGTTANLYADGTLRESATKTAWNLVPSVCYIGCYMNKSAFWNGPVDDVRIYNRALTATDVSTLYLTAPMITSGVSVLSTEGQPFSYQITASNNPTGYAATLPAWLSLNPASGIITGTATTSGLTSMTVGAINAGGTGSATVSIFVQTPYAAWQSEMFSSSQLANPAISGETATPAGDGISNLMKYALDLDPWTNETGGLPVASIITTGSGNYLALTYTQVISAVDITYTAQVSTDLQSWYSGTAYTTLPTATANPDGITESVTVQAVSPVSSNTPKQYIRLQVTDQ